MKKYLISLDKDQYRRDLFFKQNDTQDFELFSAINTMEKDNYLLENVFNTSQFNQHYSRNTTKGEIGCTLSHLAIYQKIIDNNNIPDDEYSLICEDDALFANKFEYNLNSLLFSNISSDIIILGQSKINNFNDLELEINYPTTFSFLLKKKPDCNYTISYPYKNYFAGTVAYLIKKSAVKKILSHTKEYKKPYWLADDFILFEKLGLDIQVVRPLLVIENPILSSNLSLTRGEEKNNIVKKLLKYPLKKLLAIKRNIGK
ncbi:Lsg locus protein 4 [Vespertiliibacter pulmonis]|uniref:Glycosyl transferase family 25 n=1 Tax=Vespertiliibacter pulmonis TaxID=1443036 RepID=A0A3N4VYQ5_9PAST|nr:glycosyltransferase family 25 protein [Vespertiliibacter pulmonis]QLB20322.1 Lsg locus protein 4 [Vespertiliibacter pulmonis]RPE86305.1 glycosyl transferase family 25 [Vespertiliibacter pulmonis]